MTATTSAGAQPEIPAVPTAESPWPVAILAAKLHEYIERLGSVWIEGEVTQWQVRHGTVYGKLKDLQADVTVSFTIWSSTVARLPDDVKQGDRVAVCVKVNYWVKGGSLSMIVSQLRHVGLGDLLERLQRLRAQLASEGLFDEARKKPLPFLPHLIGLITGADSDAEKDVLRNAALRWPAVRFRTVHTAVQGDRVPEEVCAAIRALDADPEVDVIIIARGGGDFQHLLGFSDEQVVRTAASAHTPIVSAIGHENDHPLLDDVADLRASTPTDAAKRVVPDVGEEILRVRQARGRLAQRLQSLLRVEFDRLAQMRSRPALANPAWIVETRGEDVLRWKERGDALLSRLLERHNAEVTGLEARLSTLSPEATLNRGYAIAFRDGGSVLRRSSDAPPGTRLNLILQHGRLHATVDTAFDEENHVH